MLGNQRNPWIDCLRGVSILIVIASHGGLTTMPHQIVSWLDPLIKGYCGVAIFFTISGFLITRNVLRRSGSLAEVDLGQFYAMRAGRIMPCLLLVLALGLALFWFEIPEFVPAAPNVILTAVYSALTFQYNDFYLRGGNVPGLEAWAPLWSLSIEEIFYFIFPIACFLTKRPAPLILIMLALLYCAPAARVDRGGLYSFWGSADLLSLGCMAAMIEARIAPWKLQRIGPVLLCGIGVTALIVAIVQTSPSGGGDWQPTTVGIGSALFLIGAALLDGTKPSCAAAPFVMILASFGRASYELYLFHLAAILLFNRLLQTLHPVFSSTAATLVALAFLAAMLGACLLISRYFSEPLNRAIRRFYTPAGPAADASRIGRLRRRDRGIGAGTGCIVNLGDAVEDVRPDHAAGVSGGDADTVDIGAAGAHHVALDDEVADVRSHIDEIGRDVHAILQDVIVDDDVSEAATRCVEIKLADRSSH
jgi:peptidoglycan/LPS O-acetylase OafA/YrhL